MAMLVVFAVIVIVIIIAWWFRGNEGATLVSMPPTLSEQEMIAMVTSGSIINCGALGKETGVSPVCRPGTHYHGGACYKDVWSQEGGVKTDICTINYSSTANNVSPSVSGVPGIDNLEIGAPCPMLGVGYHKTGSSTCQYRGVVTAPLYCQSEGYPNHCPTGSEFFAGKCYNNPCPSGFTRTNRCACTPNATNPVSTPVLP